MASALPQRDGASVVLNLDDPADLKLVNGRLKFAPGLVPGDENEGLEAQRWIVAAPRLASFDDSSWQGVKNIRDVISKGLTFAWYRFTLTLPPMLQNLEVRGAQVWFSTCIDDYGELWVDYPDDPSYKPATAIAENKLSPVQGYNLENRILVTRNAEPGTKHVIACLAANGPLAQPLGGVFMRYARLEVSQGMAKIPL